MRTPAHSLQPLQRPGPACCLARRPSPASRLRRGASTVAHAFVEREDGSLVDYYKLLGVKKDASRLEIKAAYYSSLPHWCQLRGVGRPSALQCSFPVDILPPSLSKLCHPDVCGVDGNDLCALLNDAYASLRDPVVRDAYDFALSQSEADSLVGFDPAATRSRWCGPKTETRAVFVDEGTCIGCKQCVWAAQATFRIELLHGRSQVFGQWLNNEEQIQTAIDCCPVSCIHWVQRDQLPVLEHVMATLPRVNVGIMGAGQGRVSDVFTAAATFIKLREAMAARREAERARRRAEEAVAAASEAAGGARSRPPRVEERMVDGFIARWQTATGWAWDPEALRDRSGGAPNCALVPVLSDAAQRRRLSSDALREAQRQGLTL